MKIEEFVFAINKFSKEGKPFFFLVDFELKKPYVCLLDDAPEEGVFYSVKGKSNYSFYDEGSGISGFRAPVPAENYHRAFSLVSENLNLGNTYLCNLTFPTEVRPSSEISPDLALKKIFNCSIADYKLLFKDKFTLFSPECFVRIEDDFIYSYPMKGTIDASVPDAEKTILDDKKEFWEHNTIVDLIRNDLSMVSERVEVTRYRFIDRIKMPEKELLQVSSEIRGRLPGDWRTNLGDIIVRLLPAGSISGAPKKKTVEIIRAAEGGERGYYTGIFGIFDGRNLDSAVNIRFIEKNGGRLFFRSGGGITACSNEQAEYQELMDKVNVPIG